MHDQTPARDNMLGICNAIGESFGFNPLYLRVALVLGALADFELAIIAYAACGVAVLTATLCTSRYFRPSRRASIARA